jgi:hypothetical protein
MEQGGYASAHDCFKTSKSFNFDHSVDVSMYRLVNVDEELGLERVVCSDVQVVPFQCDLGAFKRVWFGRKKVAARTGRRRTRHVPTQDVVELPHPPALDRVVDVEEGGEEAEDEPEGMVEGDEGGSSEEEEVDPYMGDDTDVENTPPASVMSAPSVCPSDCESMPDLDVHPVPGQQPPTPTAEPVTYCTFQEGGSSSSSGAAVRVPVPVESGVAPTAQLLAPRVGEGARLAAPRLDVVMGEHQHSIRFDLPNNNLIAYCEHPLHNPPYSKVKCRFTKTVNEGKGKNKLKQGRPTGVLGAWLLECDDFTCREDHRDRAKNHVYSYEDRDEGRNTIQADPSHDTVTIYEQHIHGCADDGEPQEYC